MELATGAIGPLFSKLYQLLEDEYVKQKGLRGEIESVSREMERAHAALEVVSRAKPDQLTELDKIWAGDIRELSYDMEDAIDAFMVRVAQRQVVPADTNVFKKIASKAASSIRKVKERHRISDNIKDIKNLSKELADLRARYKFKAPPVNTGVDPRVINLNKNKGKELVGIEKARDQLIRMLEEDDKSLKIVSIVGSGGLGKTTLARLVHDQLNKSPDSCFECCAYVSVGRDPHLLNILREMLDKLNCPSNNANWSAERCCEELHEFLQGKKYNIVVDDVWDKRTWDTISCTLPDSNCGSKVIVTTRNSEAVSLKASDVYKLQPLSPEMSKELFHKRTCSNMNDNGDDNSQLVDKIVDKCDGVPLAIIAIASLLADRLLGDWQTVYESLVSGRGDDSTRTILLYSYYDLPSYLRPCLLHLSMYPEDSLILKYELIWRWIGEGFVQPEKEGDSLLEMGERYFNELLNRSMIQPAEDEDALGIIKYCSVHDIVLDLIRDLSEEENFVTVLDEKKFASSSDSIRTLRKKQVGQRKVRRIFIQWSENMKRTITQDTILGGMPEVVRSLYSWRSIEGEGWIDNALLSRLQACRVLVVSSTEIEDLQHLGKLIHLRHLELNLEKESLELPKEIGNLKSLQILVIYGEIMELPAAVGELTQLMRLCASVEKVPTVDRIRNLVRLEELDLKVGHYSKNIVLDDFVVELGKLTRLRELDIRVYGAVWCGEALLVQSLNNLQQIRELHLACYGHLRYGHSMMMMMPSTSTSTSAWKTWKPPRHLWRLSMRNMGLSPQLMDPSSLLFQHLRYLTLDFAQEDGVEAVDVGNLAVLPQLFYLKLIVHGPPSSKGYYSIIFGADGFKNLRVCDFVTADLKLQFLQGAMPLLESLHISVRPVTESDVVTDMGLGNLVSLKRVQVEVDCYGYLRGEVTETEAMLRDAVEGHPNHPSLDIRRVGEYYIVPEIYITRGRSNHERSSQPPFEA